MTDKKSEVTTDKKSEVTQTRRVRWHWQDDAEEFRNQM